MTGERDATYRDALLIALTFAAGAIDAVSFLGLGAVFTANMTGNTVFLALAVGQGNLLLAIRSSLALLGFALGALSAGFLLGRTTPQVAWPSRVTFVLALELVLLGIFTAGWAFSGGSPGDGVLYALIALCALGMGLQSAASRHLAAPGISTTTVVTNALTGLMAEFAALGMSTSNAKRWAATLLAIFSGAAVGGALMLTARLVAPLVATGTVAAVCIIAYGRSRREARAPVSTQTK